jgi:hypothetical protein
MPQMDGMYVSRAINDSRDRGSEGILVRMSGKKQHYLPAVLIGGFGVAAASGRLRDATVAVRRKATGAVDPADARSGSIAWLPGMYRLAAPPPGIDRDIVDTLWDPLEDKLRDLVVRLTDRRLVPGDDELLFTYAAAAGVRHPSFADVAADYQTRNGLPIPLGDDLQYARMTALLNQLPVLRTWRWRVLHSPADV